MTACDVLDSMKLVTVKQAAGSAPGRRWFPMTERDATSLEALRREFEYRIRTAVTYGLGRGEHGDTADQDVAGWIDREIGAAMASLTVSQVIEAVRAEERERCARIAENWYTERPGVLLAVSREIAACIREQGKEQDA